MPVSRDESLSSPKSPTVHLRVCSCCRLPLSLPPPTLHAPAAACGAPPSPVPARSATAPGRGTQSPPIPRADRPLAARAQHLVSRRPCSLSRLLGFGFGFGAKAKPGPACSLWEVLCGPCSTMWKVAQCASSPAPGQICFLCRDKYLLKACGGQVAEQGGAPRRGRRGGAGA